MKKYFLPTILPFLPAYLPFLLLTIQHSSTLYFELLKVANSKKSCKCTAKISFRIKKDNSDVRYRDEFARRGLLAIVEVDNRHNHLIENAEALGWLRRRQETHLYFIDYFNSGWLLFCVESVSKDYCLMIYVQRTYILLLLCIREESCRSKTFSSRFAYGRWCGEYSK